MEQVRGFIYGQGTQSSSFSADRGHAEKGTGVLTLMGHVTISARDPEATVSCNEVVWDARRQIVVAQGGVNVDGAGYTLGIFKELWCTPDIKELATPDLFKKP